MQYDVQQRAHQQKKENKLRDHSPFQGPNSFKAITPGSAITTSAITRWQNLLTELRTTPTPFRSSQRADKQATHSAHLPQFVAWESREVRKELIRDAALLFTSKCIQLFEFVLKHL